MGFKAIGVGVFAVCCTLCADAAQATERRQWDLARTWPTEDRESGPTAGVREDGKDWRLEELRALESKDPAGFRDLLRRSLAARVLWTAVEGPPPPDRPVELAGQ